jgi:TRAP-type C4-dicarboxylate transport system permease small subunit
LISRLQKLDRWLLTGERAAAATLLTVTLVVVLLQVLMRYFFERPNPWSEEASRFGFIWLALVGASIAVERGAHFTFDEAVRALPPRARGLVRRLTTALHAVLLLAVLVAGVDLVRLTWPERSPALGLSMAWVHAAVPVAASLMLFHLLARVARKAKG